MSTPGAQPEQADRCQPRPRRPQSDTTNGARATTGRARERSSGGERRGVPPCRPRPSPNPNPKDTGGLSQREAPDERVELARRSRRAPARRRRSPASRRSSAASRPRPARRRPRTARRPRRPRRCRARRGAASAAICSTAAAISPTRSVTSSTARADRLERLAGAARRWRRPPRCARRRPRRRRRRRAVSAWISPISVGDLAGGGLGLLGELADLLGDDGEAAALLAGAGGLDRGVERQQVGLLGDAGDRVDDAADPLGAGGRARAIASPTCGGGRRATCAHRVGGARRRSTPSRATARASSAARGGRAARPRRWLRRWRARPRCTACGRTRPSRDLALGALGDLADGGGDLADRAAGLLGGGGHLLRRGRDGRRRPRRPRRSSPPSAPQCAVGVDASDGVVADLVDGLGDARDLVVAADRDRLGVRARRATVRSPRAIASMPSVSARTSCGGSCSSALTKPRSGGRGGG